MDVPSSRVSSDGDDREDRWRAVALQGGARTGVGSPVRRRLVEKAIALSSLATAQNRCGSIQYKYDLETFTSEFATRPSTAENPTFTLYHATGAWQVSRRLSSLTLEIAEGQEPQFKCWAAAQDEL
jgi:hypothetical protein